MSKNMDKQKTLLKFDLFIYDGNDSEYDNFIYDEKNDNSEYGQFIYLENNQINTSNNICTNTCTNTKIINSGSKYKKIITRISKIYNYIVYKIIYIFCSKFY